MILETKLTLPQPKAGALLRKNLIDLIKNKLDKKLILITADAGYGKTTLLAQLVKEARLPYVFVHMDAGDSDLTTFFSYMCAGLEKLSPGLAARSAILLQPGVASNNQELLMGTLINELVEKRKEELFFILDDYQHLSTESPVHQALEYFIDHMPDIVHVIIASRTAVKFASSAKWTAKQDACALSREQLSFSEAEVEELLLKTHGRPVSETDLKQVLERTEGWITGIQLILNQIRGTSQHGGLDEVLAKLRDRGFAGAGLFDYFAEEIFSLEPQPTRDFLVKTSIWEPLDAETCDEILGLKDSAILLKDMEKRNLFISRVGTNKYRYHRLFRDFLKKQMPDKQETKPLHMKAASHFQNKGMMEPAIDHYLHAEQFEEAAQAILNIADSMEVNAKYETLDNWIKQLPEGIIKKKPLLLLYKAAGCRARGLLPKADEIFLQAEGLLKTQAKLKAMSGQDRTLLARIYLRHSDVLWMNGQPDPALSNLRQALKLCPVSEQALRMNIYNSTGVMYEALGILQKAGACYRRARSIAGRIHSEELYAIKSNLANFYIRQGDVKKAFELYKTVIDNIQGKYTFEIGLVFSNVAKTVLFMGNTEFAEKWLTAGQSLCRPYQDLMSRATLNLSWGALFLQQRKWDNSRRHLETARVEFAEMKWLQGEIQVLRNLSRLCRCSGDLEKAGEYLDQARRKIGNMDSPTGVGLQIETALLETAQGRLAVAEKKIKIIAKTARDRGYILDAYLARVAALRISWGQGKKAAALRLLGQCIKTAADKGYEGILARELQSDPELVKVVARTRLAKQLFRLPDWKENHATFEASDRSVLNIKLFGALQAALSGKNELTLAWRSRKVASLFAYLLIHRQRYCEIEELMELLWPQAEFQQAEQDLRTAVYWLKKAVSSGFIAAGERNLSRINIVICRLKGYRINPYFDCRLDTEEFMESWQEAASYGGGDPAKALKCYQRCLELYRDNFLANLGGRWCEELRMKYEKYYTGCLKRTADYLLANNESAAAIDLYQKYIKLERRLSEIDEQLHANYWKALKAEGRQADIQQDYDELKSLFSSEYGMELKPETKDNFLLVMRP